MGMELRLVEEEGGGDLNLGDIGQCGELSPDRIDLSGRGPSSTPSTLAELMGDLFADKARCTAAAEGIDANELLMVAERVGLNSWLLFLERLLCVGPGTDCLVCGRIGEPSREVLGLFAGI
jgi:hypothetical protein